MIGTLMLTLFIFLTGIFTSAHAQQLTSNTLGIKITSPIKGQKVPVGSLTISGTSTHNTTTSNCPVSVIVNNVKPYQNATAIGPGGNNDYSKWNFKLTSHYTMIKEGLNKITAKLACADNPNLKKYYSVNVTGVAASASASAAVANNNPDISFFPSPVLNQSNYDNNKSKTLSISIHSTQKIVNNKGKDVITAVAYDAKSGKKVNNATIKMKITFISDNTIKELYSNNGMVTYSNEITPNSNNKHGHFTVTIQAYAPGYKSVSKKEIFDNTIYYHYSDS
jgi:hypothetical protein